MKWIREVRIPEWVPIAWWLLLVILLMMAALAGVSYNHL